MESIGKHRVNNADIMQYDINDLLRGEKVDLMYSDPPWGEGNLKYWQTINKKMTGAEPNPVNLQLFLSKILKIAADNVNGIVWIEYGIRWREYLLTMAKTHGLNFRYTVPLQYRGGGKLLPLDLHIFAPNNITFTKEYLESVSNTYGYNTLKKAVYPYAKEGMKILDPTCGMGYTAQTAVDKGMTFYGNELNAKRLEKTINRLKTDENI